MIGFLTTALLSRWIGLVATHKPKKDFWRARQGKEKEKEKSNGVALVDRWVNLKWFACLCFSQRYVFLAMS